MPDLLHVSDGYEPMLNSAGLRTLADVFAWTEGQRLDKPGLENWRQRWRLQLTDEAGRPRTLYLKRFDSPPLRRQWERWRQARRLSTAGIEWRNARELERAGIRAAPPVAFGERMIGPFEQRSAILLGEAPGESLEKWVPAHLGADRREFDAASRRRLVEGLARFVARFHAAGFVHRDLYLCHIFIDPARASAGAGQSADRAFCLIDLQRVFRPKWRKRRWVVKDLAALDFSTPAACVSRWERLRFLCRYVRHFDRFGSARLLAGKVAARNRRMARRHAKA
ncbi:MAG TPA: lipopolysaccharide kinase InaA family protein [Phycisphaerae bacterium]|nr:lipopolysaccharide kinase InaA family protein [Phycisphaerae bacterium]HOQ85806.1 lipopolysaccharide kinase InaA family protein [Phycisphaerae bacterium]HPZ97229.1 lipopolysaccharide kinase InaA family protein [Phycisphaerae bacterium]